MAFLTLNKYQVDILKQGEPLDIQALCLAKIEVWLLLMFPQIFTRPFSPKMQTLFEALDDRSLQQLVVIAFRGIGKTSIIQQGYASREICFNETDFLLTLSSSATLAVMQSESLKVQLSTNPNLVSMFGAIKSEKRESFFSKDIWITSQGNIILPRGAGQQVRGLNVMNKRPSLLLTDDAENPTELKTDESVDAFRRWFFADYINVVDRGTSSWRHIVMGTKSIPKTILKDLQSDSAWTAIDIPLCDDKCKSYHPLFMSDEKVKELKDGFTRRGALSSFFSEYMNQTTPPEYAPFQQGMFKYYDPSSIDLNKLSIAENIVLCDIAKTVLHTSADSAIVGVGVGVKQNKYWVRDIVAGKLHPEQIYNEMFDMAIRINARIIGVEVTSLEDFIKHPILDMMHARGLYFEFLWIKAVDKKENRIRELVPYYRQGYIEHNPACCSKLESQLLAFPEPDLWDVMDALANLPKALEEGERYFNFFGRESVEEVEAEFKELDNEEEYTPVPYRWQAFA